MLRRARRHARAIFPCSFRGHDGADIVSLILKGRLGIDVLLRYAGIIELMWIERVVVVHGRHRRVKGIRVIRCIEHARVDAIGLILLLLLMLLRPGAHGERWALRRQHRKGGRLKRDRVSGRMQRASRDEVCQRSRAISATKRCSEVQTVPSAWARDAGRVYWRFCVGGEVL